MANDLLMGGTERITTPILETVRIFLSNIDTLLKNNLGNVTDLIYIAIAIVVGLRVAKLGLNFTSAAILFAVLIYLILRLGGM